MVRLFLSTLGNRKQNFLQNWGLHEFNLYWKDRNSLRKMPLKPHGWSFKLRK